MRILLLNQTFHPDTVATAQYLSDLARSLAERGHTVTAISSRRAYDDPARTHPPRETWRGVDVIRIANTGLGKSAKWKRAVDFATYMLACATRLLFLRKHDVVIALTSPPLISFLGACWAQLKGARFIYWVMDLNPDEAIAAGWLRPEWTATRLLDWISRYSLRHAARVIALDRFMQDRLLAKGVARDRIQVIPPWSQDDQVQFDRAGREQFRAEHGLTNKFVVMYAGNHSPCHPLTALLEAARQMQQRSDVAFAFVGGGSEWPKVKQFASEHRLPNILCLPYQPMDQLSATLSSADLHAVVMGDPFVGIIHPCKVYNILRVGRPFLVVGPPASHASDLVSEMATPTWARTVAHQNVEGIVEFISRVARGSLPPASERLSRVNHRVARGALLPALIRQIESLAPTPA